jgi:hypothetical protein
LGTSGRAIVSAGFQQALPADHVVEWDDISIQADACRACTITLADHFDDDSLNEALWDQSYADPDASLSLARGAAVFRVPVASALRGAAGLQTSRDLDADASTLTLHMIEAPQLNDNQLFYALVQTDAATVGFNINGSELFLGVGDGFFDLGPFDPASEQWLRLTLTGGQAIAEVSEDGLDFVALVVEPFAAELTSASLNIGAVDNAFVASDEPIIIDDVVLAPHGRATCRSHLGHFRPTHRASALIRRARVSTCICEGVPRLTGSGGSGCERRLFSSSPSSASCRPPRAPSARACRPNIRATPAPKAKARVGKGREPAHRPSTRPSPR